MSERRRSAAKGGPGRGAGRARGTGLARAAARPGGPSRSKVLLVRQPVKSVRAQDSMDPRNFRLALATIIAIGTIVVVWLLGHLGHRLGFAPLVRVPHLDDDPIGALATGTTMLLSVPHMILQAGLLRTGLLMAGFVLIAIPAAALGAARPRQRGGPRASTLTLVLSSIAMALAGVNAALIVWWVASPTRAAMIGDLPTIASQTQAWAEQLQVAAGMDVLAVVVGVLWVVLVTRLNVPLWLRSLGLSATIFAVAVAAVAMAASSGAAAEVRAQRSLCVLDDQEALLLGAAADGSATVRVEGANVVVEIIDAPRAATITVTERQNLIDFLIQRLPE